MIDSGVDTLSSHWTIESWLQDLARQESQHVQDDRFGSLSRAEHPFMMPTCSGADDSDGAHSMLIGSEFESDMSSVVARVLVPL